MNKIKKPKVNHIGLTLILVILVAFFIGIMIYILNQVKEDKAPKKPVLAQEEIDEESGKPTEAALSLAILKEVDINERTVLVYDITNGQSMKLSYDGATDIRNKYNQVIAASQLIVGMLVEIDYDEGNQMLISLMNSPSAWEYTNVTNLWVDRTNKIIKLYGDKYMYTSRLYVRNQDGDSTFLSVNSDDVLTIRGYDKTIYSIEVTKGHGSFLLEDCGYFEGGTLTIAGTEYSDIKAGMVITVREGKTELEVEKDDVKESTTVEVIRNQEVEVDLSVLNPNPEEKGEVTFMITPFGAELSIDSVVTSYTNPVELTYGEHEIEVTLNGYESYIGTYELNRSTDIVQIDLAKTIVTVEPEEDDKEDEVGNNSNSTGGGSSNTTDTPTSTPTGTPTEDKPSNNATSEEAEPTEESKPDSEYETDADSDEQQVSVDKDHTISINSPSGVGVYINGTFKGIAPVQIEKPLGLTYITLTKEGYEQITHSVNIKDDKQNKYYTFPALKIQE